VQLPIDFRKRPFKPKYIDEETSTTCRWFIFGTFPDDRTVGIMGSDQQEVMTHVPLDVAQRLVFARNKFVDKVLELIK
jgi:hypothetical protein